MNTDERKLQFEEYKLFRDTIAHFDKILMNLRKNAIYFAFTILAAAITAITLKIPEGIPFGKPIDLSIVIVLIELFVVLAFYFLEAHYRYYLLKIVEVAIEYERKLEFGIKLKDCDRHNKDCDKLASISKCLECLHNNMEHHIRTAHFNIYAYLLAFGYIALSVLISIKFELPFEEIFQFFIITMLIAFGSPYLYALRNIKKQKEKYNFDDNFLVYLTPIIAFIVLTYLFYYLIFNADINIRFRMIDFIVSSFTLSYIGALLISCVIFLILGFRNNVSKIIKTHIGSY